MLGRSFKPKLKTQDSRKESQEKREKAEQMRRSHREKDLSGSKWKPGSRNVAPEARPAKAKLVKGKKVKTVEESQGQEEFKDQEESKGQEDPTIKTEEQEKKQQQDEMVNKETDQQAGCQLTFPDFPDLTFSSNDHLQPPYHHSLEAKLGLKRVMKDLPDLTDDSEDEEDLGRTIKEQGSSRSTALGDLRGGGSSSGGASLSFEEVFTMMEMLKLAIVRTGLPLRLDYDTPGDGNCFSHAVVQQGQRASVRKYLERQGKTITTFMQLKKDVRQFVLRESRLPSVMGLKASFEQKQGVLAQQGKSTRGWSTYWEDMVKNGTWADDIFVQATSLYLNLDIFLVIADSATYDRPVTPIESGDASPGRPILLIGYISDKHYQSLLLQEEEEPSMTNQIPLQALRTALDSLQLDPLQKRSKVGSNLQLSLIAKLQSNICLDC